MVQPKCCTLGGREQRDFCMCSILIVEDHDDTRHALAALLGTWGHHVSAANSVADGLAFLRRNRVDVILSDIGLPDRDGYSFIADVRRKDPHVMAIAVTAYCSEGDRELCHNSGFDMHFPKPVDLVGLRAVLASMLSSRKGAAAGGIAL